MKSPRELAEELHRCNSPCTDVICGDRVRETENALIAYGNERIEEAENGFEQFVIEYRLSHESDQKIWDMCLYFEQMIGSGALKTKKAGESK